VDEITEGKRAGERLRAAVREAVGATARLRTTGEGTVAAIGAPVQTRELHTARRERRVTQLAGDLTAEADVTGEMLETVRLACEVHDIGGGVMPAGGVTGSGRLSPAESAIIKVRPEAGVGILAPVDFGLPVAYIARGHVERLDGSGCPDGLHGEMRGGIGRLCDTAATVACERDVASGSAFSD
jgi:response regulator RpfG family c-di-GMP phosphodiesterase